ncbi:hypothetical protein GCM10009735_78010 [Actinomadura chokoriensis]
MQRISASPSGTEEWACPDCGRRVLLDWAPHYRKSVVEPGDVRVSHVCGAEPGHGPDADAGGEAMPAGGERRWMRETGRGRVAG